MSSRGRKRNDNLPPSRAREVQRAFRARRKQHLAALEERIDILEAENARLRQMLALPPSDRQPLGRGPTGREPARRSQGDGPGSSAAPLTPSLGIDLTIPEGGPDSIPAGSPPPPISPGAQHGRSPSAGAWPPPMQPPEWPPNPPHHPPGPGPSSGVRPPSPYGHLVTLPHLVHVQSHGIETTRPVIEPDPGVGSYNYPFNVPKQQSLAAPPPARSPY